MKKPFVFVLFLTLIVACNTSDSKKSAGGKEELRIENPWIRPAGRGMNSGAFFKVINNTASDDTLYNVEFEHADVVQIHSSYKTKDGRRGMKHEPFAVIKAHSEFLFKPMSYHVMLIRLKKDLRLGEKYSLKLFFKLAGEKNVKAIVKDMAM